MKPKHIAIIMDGNRRWAKSNNYSLFEAYEKGLETLYNTIQNCIKLRICYLTVFGFSTENWSRSQNEISYLLKLFDKFLDKAILEAESNDVKIKFIGDLNVFSNKIKDKTSRSPINFILISFPSASEIALSKNLSNNFIKKEISFFDLLQFSVEKPKTVKYFIFNLIKLFIVSLRVSNPFS